MRGFFQRQAQEILAEGIADEHVHLVVDEPHGYFGNAGGELFVFDAVELVYIEPYNLADVEIALSVRVERFEYFKFEQAQLAVGDDEEVAAAAGRVEKLQGAELLLELGELVAVVFEAVKFVPQLIQEQRFDELEDIRFAGVMGTEVAAFLRVHHTLEHGAEDGGRNLAPVDITAVEQGLAHLPVEAGIGQYFFEQFAVDVREGSQVFVEVFEALFWRRIEHLEELLDFGGQVAAVFAGALFDEILELLFVEDRGVFGEEAEQDAHEVHFERVTGIADFFEAVVQGAHQFGGFDIGRILFFIYFFLVADQEAEMLHIGHQFGQAEAGAAVVFQVVQPKLFKI